MLRSDRHSQPENEQAAGGMLDPYQPRTRRALSMIHWQAERPRGFARWWREDAYRHGVHLEMGGRRRDDLTVGIH